jgi:hypothetical protein
VPVPTASSWTDEARRSVDDLRALVAFRLAGVRGRSRRRLRLGAVLLVAVTVWFAVGPAWLAGAETETARILHGLVSPAEVRELLPDGFAWFLLLATGSAVATGGGRELLSRDRAVAFPVGPLTDHLGALLLAPLSLAWLVQAWTLLASTAYAGGPAALPGLPLVLAYLAAATAVGQLVGWTIEVVRRGPSGVWHTRVVAGGLAAVLAVLAGTGRLGDVLGVLPTDRLADAALEPGRSWLPVLLVELVLLGVAVLAGLWPATVAWRRPPREEHRLEGGIHVARPVTTGSASWRGDLAMLLRVDRASVWRSVPLRRGVLVFCLLPGAGSLAAGITWPLAALLPGLVASGVALLFGVNAWSLDGRGALWRESLPAEPARVFAARTVVLLELTGVSALLALLAVPLRSGPPGAVEAVAVGCAWLVAVVQVSAVAATWSVRSPYAVDLRSSRATPAPPAKMVGYSARLALTCTLTGMVFSALAQLPRWDLPVGVAVVFLGWSAVRLARARNLWTDPGVRARVVTSVAA